MWKKNTINIFISSVGLILIFYTIINFMLFLSDPNFHLNTTSSKGSIWLSTSWSLFVNMWLLTFFIVTHSLLAHPEVKKLFNSWSLDVLQRSIYIIITSISLLAILKFWQPIPEITLWKLYLNSKVQWTFYVMVHILCWIVIYIGNICRDVNELIGIKQVYYNVRNFPDPNSMKSIELQRLNQHIRHPSFLAFLLIFWVVPVMSLDRLLLATILSLYMLIAWNPDERDYQYQKYQYIKKVHELNYVN